MRPKFQADANLNHDIVTGLRRRAPGIDFRTSDSAGLRGLPDRQVLALAADDGRILVTHDRKTMPSHFGSFIVNREIPGVLIVATDVRLGSVI